MSLEIERKFLVTEDFPRSSTPMYMIQGYLNRSAERTVRVRISGDKAHMTVKGESNSAGTVRYEWEHEIPVNEAAELMILCDGTIGKVRHCIPVGNHVFEIDQFLGENAGLIVAEIELSSEDDEFERPEWLAEEVTGDIRYYNSKLSECPYSQWEVRNQTQHQSFMHELLNNQEALDPEFEKVLYDNLSSLYIE